MTPTDTLKHLLAVARDERNSDELLGVAEPYRSLASVGELARHFQAARHRPPMNDHG